jgi:phosphate transport system substrate-binding protein
VSRGVAMESAQAGILDVCPIPGAQQLAADLVRGYAAKSAISADRFVLTNAAPCDVRFSTVSDTPEDIIARDGIVAVVNPLNTISHISEKQLRDIFSGSVRDWSQLGGTPGAIVPILPDAASDEAKALESSLFFGVSIGHGVRRSGSSADVTRRVTGAERASRNAIGLVAFSQALTAKVLPLADFPPPSVLSIASHVYPYTLTIAMQAAPKRNADVAAGLIGFARSSDGAAIVLRNGLTPREGL